MSARDERSPELVPLWTGREVRLLREARRMSVRAFAAHLGVSDRMVSKWESGGIGIRPRPINQAALDTSFRFAPPEDRSRFIGMMSTTGAHLLGDELELAATWLLRHPCDDKLMTLVPAGFAHLGPDRTPTWLPGYFIDVYPTTNADYARYLTATDHQPPAHWNGRNPPAELSDHPVVGVSADDAQHYARWAAKHLPTAEQWEKAARGAKGARFPWGDEPAAHRCNVRESRVKTTTPVRWFAGGVSPYGVFDLCGNVWEWCSAPTLGWQVRGGAFTAPMHQANPTTWRELPARTYRDDFGFRCVLSLEEAVELLSI